MSEYKMLLKNKKFLYLWASQVLSQITINILNFTFLFKIFHQTGSTIATSMLWVSYALPALLVGPFAAASVDLLDRKKVLVITNLAQSLLILIYALTFSTRFYVLYGIVLMYSLLNQFYVPAEMASLPTVLKKKGLENANSLFFLTLQVAIVIGFGSAGFLISILGFSNTLYLCSFLLFVAFMSVLKLPSLKTDKENVLGVADSVKKFFSAIWEGYEYIKGNNYVLGPLVLLLILNTLLTIFIINLPIIATQLLDFPLGYTGVLIAVPAGLGAGVGAFFLPRLLKKGYRKIKILRVSFFIMTFSIYLLLFLIPELGLLLRILVSMLVIFALGVAFVAALIPIQTYLQQTIPDSLMGRVFGNYWFLSVIVSLFPVLFSSTIAEIFGVKVLVFVLSTISLGVLYFLAKHGEDFIKSGFKFTPKTV